MFRIQHLYAERALILLPITGREFVSPSHRIAALPRLQNYQFSSNSSKTLNARKSHALSKLASTSGKSQNFRAEWSRQKSFEMSSMGNFPNYASVASWPPLFHISSPVVTQKDTKMCCSRNTKAVVAVSVMVVALVLSYVCISLIIGGNLYYSIPLAACLVAMGPMCYWVLCCMEEDEQGPITMLPA